MLFDKDFTNYFGFDSNFSASNQVLFSGSSKKKKTSVSNIDRNIQNYRGRCPRGVMVKAMDCGIVVSEFVLHSGYYVHFRANTVGKV